MDSDCIRSDSNSDQNKYAGQKRGNVLLPTSSRLNMTDDKRKAASSAKASDAQHDSSTPSVSAGGRVRRTTQVFTIERAETEEEKDFVPPTGKGVVISTIPLAGENVCDAHVGEVQTCCENLMRVVCFFCCCCRSPSLEERMPRRSKCCTM